MWHLIVLTIPAQLHHCVLCEAIRLHVAFDRIPIVISALHPAAARCSESDDGWLRVALQCGFNGTRANEKTSRLFRLPKVLRHLFPTPRWPRCLDVRLPSMRRTSMIHLEL